MLDFDLVETVESTLERVAERAQTKGIELASDDGAGLATRLRGDPGRLRQILTNLVGNALKFTNKGEVVVRVSTEGETETHAEVRFEVQDSGIGISLEAQGRLFQAFSQADGSTTRKYGGTGLGLAISRQLVVLMEGKIGIRSEPGKGSTFWFTVKLEKQTGESETGHASAPDRFNMRVLVVDDNHTNRQILRNQIGAWKMQVDSAASGEEALDRLRVAVGQGQPYDVALLDVQMPEMDGFALAAAIKGDPALADTRLIVLTSMGHALRSAELKQLGIEGYLVKPVKQSRLFDCLVNEVRAERRSNQPLASRHPSRRLSRAPPKSNPSSRRHASSWQKTIPSTKKSRWLNCVDCVTGPMPWPMGARCWRLFRAFRTMLFSWTARCRKWTATRRLKRFANGKAGQIHHARGGRRSTL